MRVRYTEITIKGRWLPRRIHTHIDNVSKHGKPGCQSRIPRIYTRESCWVQNTQNSSRTISRKVRCIPEHVSCPRGPDGFLESIIAWNSSRIVDFWEFITRKTWLTDNVSNRRWKSRCKSCTCFIWARNKMYYGRWHICPFVDGPMIYMYVPYM